MNFSSKNPENFPVDVPLVKKLLTHLMVRNEIDPVKRFEFKTIFEKNIESLNMAPEGHLGYILSRVAKDSEKGLLSPFETGLMFGVTMTLSARSANGKGMLKQIIQGIEDQQEADRLEKEKNGTESQPKPESGDSCNPSQSSSEV